MKKFLIGLGIALALYFVYRVWRTKKKVEAMGDAIKDGAIATVMAPVNTASSVMAGGAFVWDLIRGVPYQQAKQVFNDTTTKVWQ
jgi:hypothetical protein